MNVHIQTDRRSYHSTTMHRAVKTKILALLVNTKTASIKYFNEAQKSNLYTVHAQ